MISKRIKELINGEYGKGIKKEHGHYAELQWYACEKAAHIMGETYSCKEALDESIRITLDYAEDNHYFIDDHDLFLIIRKVSYLLYGGLL